MKTIILDSDFYLSMENLFPNIYLLGQVIYKRCRLYNFEGNESKIKDFTNLMRFLNTYKDFKELNKPINIIQESCQMKTATHAYGYTMNYFDPNDYYLFDDIVNKFDIDNVLKYLYKIKDILKTNLKNDIVYYNVTGNNIMLSKDELNIKFISPDEVAILGINRLDILEDKINMYKSYMNFVLSHLYPDYKDYEIVDILKKIDASKELIEYIEYLNNNINPGMFITELTDEFNKYKINYNYTKIKRLQK